MTRAAGPAPELRQRSFGAPAAERTVFVLRAGPAAMTDPEPGATMRRDVRVVAMGVTAENLADPAAYRGATPAAVAANAISELVTKEAHSRPVGLVGVGSAGELALMVAADLGDRVDRLAIVAMPEPATPLDREEVAERLQSIAAQTLVVNGRHDPEAASAAAEWLRSRLPSARVEMVPGVSDEDPRVSLADQWDRVLAHVAPGTAR